MVRKVGLLCECFSLLLFQGLPNITISDLPLLIWICTPDVGTDGIDDFFAKPSELRVGYSAHVGSELLEVLLVHFVREQVHGAAF